MEHGGDLSEARRRHGGDAAIWLDLSTGINPHPWPIPDRLRQADWTRLPGRDEMDDLLVAAREAYDVPEQGGIVAAPGTQALIQWLPQLAGRGPVAILGPTYGEHARSWSRAGFEPREITAPDQIGDARHVVLVSPNNPDGRIIGTADMVALAEGCRERQGWLVVDESFADIAPDISIAGATGDLPIVVLRSFGKFYGLAGLRLGFAVAPLDIARRLAEALGPWAVSAPAIAIGAEALRDTGWATRMRQQLTEQSQLLDAVLSVGGLWLVGGTSLYRLVRHPRAGEIHDRLAAQHVWVRRFPWKDDLLRFGLPPDAAGRDRLAAALRHATTD